MAVNGTQRPPGGRLPVPSGQLSRPAPLVVPGSRNVRQVLRDLCAGVRRECVMVHDQRAAREAGLLLPVATWPGVEVRALDGVVLVRYAVSGEPGEQPGTGTRTGAAGANGAGRRAVPSPDQGPLRLVLVDRSAALVPLRPGSTLDCGALVVRDPAVTGSLHAMYAALWRHARPLPPHDGGPPPALLPVLDALLQGLTDVAAAKRLGVSPRTYSRRVAELLGVLGITSRTQVGAAALAKGWTTRSPS